MKVIFIPGNGNASVNDNWFPYVKQELEKNHITVVAEDFPDADLARKSIWLPFLREQLNADKKSVLIGHSSGAIAAMRYAESYPILGSMLVGAYYTDLNMEKEQNSGYFDQEWNWSKIASNQKFISLFASVDDPWVPIEHPRYIHTQLACEYHEYTDQGHFGGDYVKQEFPELVLSLMRHLKQYKAQE